MAFSLCCGKARAYLLLLAYGRKVGEGYIKLSILHVHIYADKPVLFVKRKACFYCIVKQVPYYAAKIKLAHFKLNGNMRIYFHLYALGLGKGYLAVYYCIRHRVNRFYCQINCVQVSIQHIQIIVYAVHVALCRKRLQHLYMVAVIVPPAAHLAIHIVHLFIMRIYQLPLIRGYALIYLP